MKRWLLLAGATLTLTVGILMVLGVSEKVVRAIDDAQYRDA